MADELRSYFRECGADGIFHDPVSGVVFAGDHGYRPIDVDSR
jgi:hypothetical protein